MVNIRDTCGRYLTRYFIPMQTISFLGVLRTLCGVRTPHLVICPASLIQNWAREFKHWCPGMRVLMYHGKEREGVRTAVQRWRKKVLEARKDGFIDKVL